MTDWLDAIDFVLVRAPGLSRAALSLATPLGSLDAMHLAMALVWRERMRQPWSWQLTTRRWRSRSRVRLRGDGRVRAAC